MMRKNPNLNQEIRGKGKKKSTFELVVPAKPGFSKTLSRLNRVPNKSG